MTDIFALDPEGQAELDRTARTNSVGFEALNQATPFEGTMLGIGDGLMRGGARVAQAAGLAVAAPFAVYERATGQEGRFTDSIFRVTDEYATRAVDYWTPSAAEVGKAGQILGGLAEIAAPLMLAGGNPSLLIATQTAGPAVDLVRQGVDATAAGAVGALQGASTAVGFRLPILGSALASRLATGAAGNLALGTSTLAAQRAVLEASGTPEATQAAQGYDPASAESAALDVLTGLVFGGLTHVHVTTAQREAVLTALNAKHFQSDTAPGQPGDVASFVAHQRAMEQATEQLVRGEPVTPSAAITEASFQPRATPDPEATLASLREVLPEGERAVTEVTPYLAPQDNPNFQRFIADSVVRNADGAPLVVYHGTRADIGSFDPQQLGKVTGAADAGEGFFFSASPRAASEFAYGEGGNVLPVYLAIKNPLVTDFVVRPGNLSQFATVVRQAKKLGHDGVAAFADVQGEESPVFVAFDSKQIKSAVGNSGRFDPESPSLTDAAAKQTPASTNARGSTPDVSDQAIEARFAEQLKRDPAAAEAQYAANPDSKGGKVLNTDTARELSPDYLADRTRSAAVHEPASAFIKALYAKKLTEAPKPGERSMVLFTAGGTGAGKSTGINTVLGDIQKVAQIIYDTNMNGLASSIQKIDQALAAGKQVVIAYTMRDPIQALREGALPRAMRQEAKHGSGRSVPIEEHVKTHVGSAQAIPQLGKHYADNPNVDLHVIDNNRGPKGARLGSLAEVPQHDYNSLREQALRTLDEERAAGRISESVYRGFRGPAEDAAQGTRKENRAIDSRQPEPQRDGGAGRGPEAPSSGSQGSQQVTDPDVRAAHEAVAARDFDIPTGETGPDGQLVTVSARQLLADAAAAVERAKADAPAFQAAVNCLLRGGA